MNVIYALIDPRTQQIRYVGQSSRGLHRPKQHWAPTQLNRNSNPHKCNWLKSVLKDRFKPEVEILEEVATYDELNEAEEFWISYLRFVGCDLLNIKPGGQAWIMSNETKKRIGAANKGRKPSKLAIERSIAARLGKPMSESTKKAVREAARRPRGPLHKEIRLRISKGHGGKPFWDQNGIQYETQGEAARQLGLSQGEVSAVLQGKRRLARGYIFTYTNPNL